MISLHGRCYRFSVLFLALFLVACGGSSASTEPTATPEFTAGEILERASQRLAETETLRFHLGVDGETFVDPANTIQLLEADGELQRPDRVHVRFKIRIFPGVTITTELITIGDQHWTTDLITGDWGQAPYEFTYDPTVLFDNQGGVGPVMNKVDNSQLLGVESVNGRDAYHISATANEEVIGPVTSNTMHGSPISVNLWIAIDTFDLLRAQLSEPSTPENDDPATWTLDLLDQDESITVEPPE